VGPYSYDISGGCLSFLLIAPLYLVGWILFKILPRKWAAWASVSVLGAVVIGGAYLAIGAPGLVLVAATAVFGLIVLVGILAVGDRPRGAGCIYAVGVCVATALAAIAFSVQSTLVGLAALAAVAVVGLAALLAVTRMQRRLAAQVQRECQNAQVGDGGCGPTSNS